MRYIILPLMLTVAACHSCGAPGLRGNREIKPRQQDAMVLVWNTVYGVTTPPPPIYWMEGAALTCKGGVGWPDEQTGACIAGEQYNGEWGVMLAWPTCETSYAEVQPCPIPLAHEYRHVIIDDPTHTSDDWKPGGIVDRANKALIDAGL